MFVSLHTVGGMMVSRKHNHRVYVILDIVVDGVVEARRSLW